MNKVRRNISATWKKGSTDGWFVDFICRRCDVGFGFKEYSMALYRHYLKDCLDIGESAHSTTEFYGNIKNSGFVIAREGTRQMVRGLRLKERRENA